MVWCAFCDVHRTEMLRTGKVDNRGWGQLLISVEQDAQDPAHEVQVVMGRRRGRSVQGKRSDISFGDTRQPL